LDLNLVIGVVLGIVVVWVALLAVFWILRPRGASIRDVLALVPDVLRLLRSLIADRSVPLDCRLVLLGLLAWIVSPIDLIPEFLPGIGPIDDVVVAIVAFRYVRRRVGVEELRRRWLGTESGFELLLRVIGGRPLPS
jgi:uncharacterized membrane protein YkvA (DUF1232 family)